MVHTPEIRMTDEDIGFILLYFKMAVMPLVSETKMVDVGKLISLGILLVRKVTWLVLTTTSVTWIFVRWFWSWLHDKNYLYIHSSFKNSFFPFRLTETTRSLSLRLTKTTHFFHFDFQRQHTLSLTFDFQQSTPQKCILSATIFFIVLPLRLDLLQPRKQPQKFRQTIERNKQPT